jgi:hypothetical protein
MVLWFAAIICVMGHLWPDYGCTRLENQGILHQTTWWKANGDLCGHAWPNDDGSWHAFHESGLSMDMM